MHRARRSQVPFSAIPINNDHGYLIMSFDEASEELLLPDH